MSKPSLLKVWGDCSGLGGEGTQGTSLALQSLTLWCVETKLSGTSKGGLHRRQLLCQGWLQAET